MSILHYQQNALFIEQVDLRTVAEKFGTPCYVYSKKQLEENWQAFANAFADISHCICYAVKANGNLTLLKLLALAGCGFDIVSLGELERVLMAGGIPEKIVFSGVGKSAHEIEQAILHQVGCLDVESFAELERIDNIATRLQKKVNIAFRVNPDIKASTHAHIATGGKDNKFGIDIEQIPALTQQLSNMPFVNLIGLAAHIGSQITELDPFLQTLDRLLLLYTELKKQNIVLTTMNVGGGLGITYQDENPPTVAAYATALKEKLKPYPLKLILEPGRAMIANTGALLTRVEYLKQEHSRQFAIVDAGMNDFLRPALYDAWQNILPVIRSDAKTQLFDIAGPVCESADIFGKDRALALKANDLLAIDTVGAYGFCMSSNYNARPRPPEILISGNHMQLIRRRETLEDLLRAETALQPIEGNA